MILSFLISEGCAPDTCAEVQVILKSLPSVKVILSKGRAKCLRVEPLILSGEAAAKKGAVFFSIIQLVTVILQENATVRRHCIASSELWKTGTLFGVQPDVYDDMTAGSAFRSNSYMCGKAGPGASSATFVLWFTAGPTPS